MLLERCAKMEVRGGETGQRCEEVEIEEIHVVAPLSMGGTIGKRA
jgi:hypothetical protein